MKEKLICGSGGDSADPASIYLSFPPSQGFTFPPSVSAPSLRQGAARIHRVTKPRRSVVNSEFSQRAAGGNGDTHLGLGSFSVLIPSLRSSLALP